MPNVYANPQHTNPQYANPQYANIQVYKGEMTFDSAFLPLPTKYAASIIRPSSLSEKAISVLGTHNAHRFVELKALKDGWDFGRGKALTLDSLWTMESFLGLYHSFPERCSLFLSERGNLELAWDSGNNVINSLEFYPQHIEYYLEATDDEGEVLLPDIRSLVQKLLSATKNA